MTNPGLEMLQQLRRDANSNNNNRFALALTIAISELIYLGDKPYINNVVKRYQEARKQNPRT